MYISYDGLTDPLGQSQILPYLRRLKRLGHDISIISFEKDMGKLSALSVDLESEGIVWKAFSYRNSPALLSTFWNLWEARSYMKTYLFNSKKFDIVHCRGYISSFLGAYLKRKFGVKFIFDMRGWWPDEKKDSGSWEKGLYKFVFYYFKKVERFFFRYADYIISLTEAGKSKILLLGVANEKKIGVTSTCVDFDSFPEFSIEIRSETRKGLDIPLAAHVMVYSGALGGNYPVEILLPIVESYLSFSGDNYFIIASHEDSQLAGFKSLKEFSRIRLVSSTYKEIHKVLMASDLGFIFYKPGISNIGRCPTKLGEYWASGLYVYYKGDDIGDLASFAGRDFPLQQYVENTVSSKQMPVWSKSQLRDSAKELFNIDNGVKFYNFVYSIL